MGSEPQNRRKRMLKKFLKQIRTNTFIKNTLILITGTTIAQAIPIIVSPFLTRMYSPSDFGTFGLYIAITAIISVIATGRYELAIMLPKKDEDAINIFAVSIFFSIFTSIFILVIILLFNNIITKLSDSFDISVYLYFVPVTILFTAIYQSLNYWNNRKNAYNRLSISRITQSGITAASNISIGYLKLTNGLILGNVIGQGTATFILSKILLKEDKNILLKIKKDRMIYLAKRYIMFPKNTIFSSFINSFYNNGKYLILGLIFSSNILGQLLLSYRVLLIPVSIISTSIADILFQKSSIWNNSNIEIYEVRIKLKKILLILMIIATIPSILLYFGGEVLFSFVFGQKWVTAGQFASTLSIALFFQFSISPFCKIFYVLERQSLYLKWEILRLIIVFVPVLFLGYIGVNYNHIILVMSINIAISYILLLIFLNRVLK
jgi:O-antigen/teichoic acid export membrane protein